MSRAVQKSPKKGRNSWGGQALFIQTLCKAKGGQTLCLITQPCLHMSLSFNDDGLPLLSAYIQSPGLPARRQIPAKGEEPISLAPVN